MAKATTVRFTDEMYARLDQASARTGLPVNSIVIAACLEWMQRNTPEAAKGAAAPAPQFGVPVHSAPRWATLRRAVRLATSQAMPMYPFERFTTKAQRMLTAAQAEANKSGDGYIGTEHLLLAAFGDAESHSAVALASLGVEEKAVRQKLDEVVARQTRSIVQQMMPTTRVKQVIEIAFRLCSAAGDPRVSTGHILLALAAEGNGIAAHVLSDFGAPADRIESALASTTEPEP